MLRCNAVYALRVNVMRVFTGLRRRLRSLCNLKYVPVATFFLEINK